MKLHCPHCGVRGSAADSYVGQKVKCPKCQGIFEVVHDTDSELPEEHSYPAAPPSLQTESPIVTGEVAGEVELPITADDDFAETEADESLPAPEEETEELDERLTETEEEPLAGEQEEMLSWDDVAQEIELQSVEDEREELEETLDGHPADLSTFEEEFEEPADDLDYVVEEDNPAEVDFVDGSGNTVQNEEIYEDDLSVGWIQEAVEEADERDPGALEDRENLGDSGEDRNNDEALSATGLNAGATDFMENGTHESSGEFSIGSTVREAWSKTKGAKGTIWAGSAIMYLVLLIMVAGAGLLLPSLIIDRASMAGLAGNIFFQVVISCFNVLFTAGLLLMGIRKAAEETISWKMIFKGFSCAGKILIASVLQFVIVTIGFILLIIPGIYLSMGYIMTIPLIVDKGLSPWQAMETSRKAVHKVWWKVAGIFTVMGLIFMVSFIPLGIGAIWAWPMFIVLAGVVYRHLYGQGNTTA